MEAESPSIDHRGILALMMKWLTLDKNTPVCRLIEYLLPGDKVIRARLNV